MKLSHLCKVALPLALAGTLVAGVPLEALACTQVWMPDKFTAEENTWYFGRAEDGGYRGVKIFGIEPSHDAGFEYWSGESDFSWKSPTPTYRYTYVRDHQDNWGRGCYNAYSAAGINENGVSCSATLSVYPMGSVVGSDGWDKYNDDGGVGEYNYASIILGQSKTAREGVALIGKLVEEYGALSSDQVVVSDSKESWLLTVLSGHQWIAFQLPEDEASVNPNLGLEFAVDLNDPDVLHSKEIVSKPAENNALVYFEDGKTPDIAKTYFKTTTTSTRYAMGRLYFGSDPGLKASEGVVESIDDPALFFTPGRNNFTTFDMIRSLATRGEGTAIDANKYKVDAIGKNWSLETHIFEIKRNSDPQLATLMWLALSRDEFSVAIPNYSALLTKVNKHYGNFEVLDSAHQGKSWGSVDDYDEALKAGSHDQYLPYVLMDINTLAYANRANVAEGLRGYLDALQRDLITQNDQVEAALYATPRAQRTELANKAADVAAELTWERCYNVLQELRSYLDGDQAKPFVPSDYNVADKSLVDPLTYADEVVPDVPTGTWKKTSGKWWYAHSDGSWATGWEKIDGKWYRFDKSGWMQTGWQKVGGKWYYMDASGAMRAGWVKASGKWYYLGAADDGAMKTGWQKVGGKWYLLGGSNDGAMKTGWQKVDGVWYYMYGSGAMAASTWVGPYWVTASGAWTRTR